MFTFNLISIFEEIKMRLDYISGKRAATADEFFRFTVCETDYPLLGSLVREAAVWISCNSPFSFSMTPKKVTFSTSSVFPDENKAKELLKDILLRKTAGLWLDIAGAPTGEFPDLETVDKIADLNSEKSRGKLILRPLHPF